MTKLDDYIENGFFLLVVGCALLVAIPQAAINSVTEGLRQLTRRK